MQINRNFDNLVPNYLFAEVASRTNKYMQEHPDKKVIKLGIGLSLIHISEPTRH